MNYNIELLNNFVNDNGIILLDNYFKVTRNTIIKGKCFICENSYEKSFRKLYNNKIFYCKKCSKNIKFERIKQTCIAKYGCISNLQLEETKEKIKQTNLKKYGVEHNSYSDEVKYKRRKTCLEKYGKEYYSQTPEFKQKMIQTSLHNWGTEFPNQNADVMEKNSKKNYSKKDFIFPSGECIKIQGYENYAINELLKTIEERNIITGAKNVPEIWYTDNDNKKHRHYVDIFIPTENLCIEVKSIWTLEKKKDNIFLKQNAAKELGYKYEIWVYDAKGICVEKYI
jgi:hypothetical protein